MPQTITPLDILTSGGQHNEREKDPECTTSTRINAADLAERVSKLLDCLGRTASVSSGFRTVAANKAMGGSTLSAHCEGKAVDLHDPQGSLAAAITADPSLLATYDLYAENPYYTKGWVHLSTRPTASGRRIFTP
jgi:hypothetical protein